VEVVVLVDLDV
jgi:hypothetical protein